MNFLQKIRLPQGLPSQYVEQLARVGAMPPIAAAFKPHEIATVRKNVATVDAWLDRFVIYLHRGSAATRPIGQN